MIFLCLFRFASQFIDETIVFSFLRKMICKKRRRNLWKLSRIQLWRKLDFYRWFVEFFKFKCCIIIFETDLNSYTQISQNKFHEIVIKIILDTLAYKKILTNFWVLTQLAFCLSCCFWSQVLFVHKKVF